MPNSIDFTVTTLWLRDSVTLILCKKWRKANLFGYILVIHNIFVLFNSSSIRGVMIKKHIRFQSYVHFTLVWREWHRVMKRIESLSQT